MALDATNAVSVSAIGDFDEIIDVRSPAEYAEDCIPQAINLPALQNNERALSANYTKTIPLPHENAAPVFWPPTWRAIWKAFYHRAPCLGGL